MAAGILYAVTIRCAKLEVEVESLGEQRYRVVLIMKRFITVGEGELRRCCGARPKSCRAKRILRLCGPRVFRRH